MKITTYSLFFISILFISCADQSLKLPLSDFKGIQDTLYDNSQIWVFDQEGMAELNWSNRIGTTDWLINIDRNLDLKEVLPVLDKIQQKRSAKAMHKREDASNYLTFANPKFQAIQILPIQGIAFAGTCQFPNTFVFNTANIRYQNDKKIDSLWQLEFYEKDSYQELIIALSRLYEEQPQNYASLAEIVLVKND